MNDQPKSKIRRGEPATGEWTADDITKICDEFPTFWQSALATRINAALAASVHYWQGVATQEWHKGFAASHDEHQKQLAAEREVVFNLDKQVQEITEALITARQQLVAEKEGQ